MDSTQIEEAKTRSGAKDGGDFTELRIMDFKHLRQYIPEECTFTTLFTRDEPADFMNKIVSLFVCKENYAIFKSIGENYFEL